MKMFLNPKQLDNQIINLIQLREIQESAAHVVSQKLHVTENLVARLGLEKELSGHGGCVNCLEWNETGEILASASDDVHVILWDAFRYQKKLVLHAGHNGNIFSVKFMPKSNDSILVSGAADCRIRVHDLVRSDTILACNCHTGRVKRIATAPSVPFLFWSAAEDGLILQYDIRVPHNCNANDRKSVLVNLSNHLGRYAEAKCISINPRRPELIAVGANDAYIRMYDRRMIKLASLQVPASASPRTNWDGVNVNGQRAGEGDPENNIPLESAQYFIAGHLHNHNRDHNRTLTATYLTFSADGNELLVNMGGEQIYLFDINNQHNSRLFAPPQNVKFSDTCWTDTLKDCVNSNNKTTEDYSLRNTKVLPPHVEAIKLQANEGFEQQKYTLAINLYNKAISHCSTAAMLYANRAAALMKRAWDSDVYAAFRDCRMTLLLDPEHVKAHFRLARCLIDLNRPAEACKAIESFQEKFPEYITNSAFRALKKDIKEAMNTGEESTRTNHPSLQMISTHEQEWRRNTIDYKLRFCGHCNTTTDIKEANFFGNYGQYIVAGSDDGSFFIWDRKTTNIVRVLQGDGSIVNCLQPHPSTCLLATSGIDTVIRLWSPLPEDGSVNEREILNLDDAASANQIRMNSDPFELMLMNLGYRFPGQHAAGDEDSDESQEPRVAQALNCRPS
ncbi:WD and tetratricopeptide repeats protein 1 [Cephus cinctus]|uniref:WD and tetratricopeptide repeats protein 1 n=1 Tax=Cephus cinctus TaxID=211228 RepID=A0AAJ7CFT4_CEPCN|nr:WD and tetratricopeptide repeats protein 1 [Cephus cinctus]XP_015609814.1 WD and tetratricopeptide repeats protein 1 [Cephus cinctus]XP_015609816.1 WD and tetratricopeptide repeats protein 1 [Cephus cinctus]